MIHLRSADPPTRRVQAIAQVIRAPHPLRRCWVQCQRITAAQRAPMHLPAELDLSFRSMGEIRVCWSHDVEHDERGVFRDGGVWYVDSPEIRSGLRLIVMSENFMHGKNTHWLGVRDNPLID